MNTHANKTQENKSQSVSIKKSQIQRSGESTFQFVDNRPEAIAQRKLQAMANNYSTQRQQPKQKKTSLEPSPRKNNTGLPDNLKTGMENLSGISLDDVKVHRNSNKPAQLQAHAFAQGIDIHLGPGQGKHLPHEAWHVVQQKQGRVKPTLQMKGGVNVNDDVGLEKEADLMGIKSLGQDYASQIISLKSSNESTKIIQRAVINATVVWQVTHLVPDDNGSIFIGIEPEPSEGQLYLNDELEIDDNDIIVSRRGPNQENPQNKDFDEHREEPIYDWYRVLSLRGIDIYNKKLYIRENTFTFDKKEAFKESFKQDTLPGQAIDSQHFYPLGGDEESESMRGEYEALYQRIQGFLLNPDLVFKVLNLLDKMIEKEKGQSEHKSSKQWHQFLLAELSDEGFNQEPEEIKTLLEADEFITATTGKGTIPLDTGADKKYYELLPKQRVTKSGDPLPPHGALSHTIQWLIIQEGLKHNPEAMTLLDIFITTSQFKKKKGTPGFELGAYLWSSLVDLSPLQGFVVNATMPEGLTTLINEHFPFIKQIEAKIHKEFGTISKGKPNAAKMLLNKKGGGFF